MTRPRALADFKADARLLVLAAMAGVIGSLGAAPAWALMRLIALVTNVVWFGRLEAGPLSLADASRTAWMLAAPVVGGLVVGLMARYGSEKIRGHGIPEAIEAIMLGDSRLSPRVALLKPLSSAITIGTGGPFGAEGPIIMTGGALGSLFAQFFHLSAAERKTLLVAGAAAGMTGIFGTPVAAVLLAVELLLFEWRARSFIPVGIAAVTAMCWRPWLFGPAPLFAFHGALPELWRGLVLASVMGALGGLLASLLTWLLYQLEDGFQSLRLHWMWWPALGGIVVGLGGLIEPRALGVGYDVIEDLLAGHMVAQAVATILLIKAVIWLVALSSGTSGGILAPLLIMGGSAGWLAGLLLPGSPSAWALIGMAATLGGAMRAPLMAAVFAMELTGDLGLLPALLAATVTAYFVTVLLMKRCILTGKIARRGVHVTREYGIDPFELTRVEEIMTRDVDALSADMTVEAAVGVLERGPHHLYPVLDANRRPVGWVSRADALRWEMERRGANERVGDRISDASLTVVHPGDLTVRAVELMLQTDQGRLPVTNADTGVMVGLVSRKDLLDVRTNVARSETERRAYFTARWTPVPSSD